MKTIFMVLSTLFLVSCVSEVPTMEQISGNLAGGNSPKAFVYRLNSNDDSISIGSIDLTNGRMTEIDTVRLPTDSNAKDFILHPSKKFLYVANFHESSILVFATDLATGALHLVEEKEVDSDPHKMVIHPSGKYLYVYHDGGKISMRSINLIEGTLSGDHSASAFEGNAWDIVIDPGGRYLYANTTNKISIFGISYYDGTIPSSTNVLSSTHNKLLYHPSNGKLYGALSSSGPVNMYRTSSTNVQLEAQAATDANTTFKNFVFSPTGSRAYLLNFNSKKIETHEVNAVGSFTNPESYQLPASCYPQGIEAIKTAPILVVSCAFGGDTYSLLLDQQGKIMKDSVNVTNTSTGAITDLLILDPNSVAELRPEGSATN